MNYLLQSNRFKTCEDQDGVTKSLITYELQHLLMSCNPLKFRKQAASRSGYLLRLKLTFQY